jgi:hypothetical protein
MRTTSCTSAYVTTGHAVTCMYDKVYPKGHWKASCFISPPSLTDVGGNTNTTPYQIRDGILVASYILIKAKRTPYMSSQQWIKLEEQLMVRDQRH